eukprot:TRINITY_DN1187_c0_g1_i4.p2 TRINITY_DN1187_c0_g1~~TRINITY_DN1187_c0_g1_i4.p2  ORF type:complete len:113 (-),score=25.81 TRINITY_DN1187_c0_g1_i4:479-817(-)
MCIRDRYQRRVRGPSASTMIPVVIVLFGHFLVPETFVSQALAPLPFRLNPFQSLLIAVALVYLPFGLNLLNKIKITGGKVDNVNPRRQAAQLEATHPSFARLSVRAVSPTEI